MSYRLNTDDVYILATCYQLALKIGFALAKRVGFSFILFRTAGNAVKCMKVENVCSTKSIRPIPTCTGFLSAVCPRGGGLGKYMYVSVCKMCGKIGGFGGMLPREILILELLLHAI